MDSMCPHDFWNSCTAGVLLLRSGESRPSLHWKGLLFIARASRIYRPRPRALPRGHGELLKLLRVSTQALQVLLQLGSSLES